MSEFQYYEFQTVDRQLSTNEMDTLRKSSSRARITPSRFVNSYSFGDFKGNVKKWVEKYFDGFLYIANWGTRRLIFRFPKQAIDEKIVQKYCADDHVRCWTTDTHLLVEFSVEECCEDQWLEEDDDSLSRIIPVRSEVFSNDYRLFYLGWLLSVQYGELSAKAIEPPVPLGLRALTPALKAFVKFFKLDKKLLNSAASASSDQTPKLDIDDIEPCIAGLSNHEKLDWLCRLALEDNPNLQREFRLALLPDSGVDFFSDKPSRTVGEITGSKKRV